MVCVLTGHGLKDPDLAISQISVPTVVDADLGAVLAELSALRPAPGGPDRGRCRPDGRRELLAPAPPVPLGCCLRCPSVPVRWCTAAAGILWASRATHPQP